MAYVHYFHNKVAGAHFMITLQEPLWPTVKPCLWVVNVLFVYLFIFIFAKVRLQEKRNRESHRTVRPADVQYGDLTESVLLWSVCTAVHFINLHFILSCHTITLPLRPNTKTLFFNFNSTSNHSSWANLSKQWQKTAGVKKYHIRWLKALKQKWKVNDNYQCKPASSEQAHYYSCSLIWPYFGTHLSKTLMCL